MGFKVKACGLHAMKTLLESTFGGCSANGLVPCQVDRTINKNEMIAHYLSHFGAVTGISMKPTRGYTFVDYRSNDCVQRALRSTPRFLLWLEGRE